MASAHILLNFLAVVKKNNKTINRVSTRKDSIMIFGQN